MEMAGFRLSALYIEDFAWFNVCSSYKNCPSARCASAANVVCRDVPLNYFYADPSIILKH
jgi:hypothetical protein